MTARLAARAAAAAILLAALALPTHASGTAAMDDATPLLNLVDRLVEARPLTASATGRLVGVALAPVGGQSSERKLVYAAAGTPSFAHVELRLPGPKSTNAGQFLVLDVDPRTCIAMAAVQKRYGQPELSVPTPREPADTPLFLRFTRDWGTLSFGFARSGDECLRTVVLDVAAAPAAVH